MHPDVVNLADGPTGPDTVRVDRATPWGNPYRIGQKLNGRLMDRADVIGRFTDYALTMLESDHEWLAPLRGKRLACHCAPLDCHAEVLAKLRDVTVQVVNAGAGPGPGPWSGLIIGARGCGHVHTREVLAMRCASSMALAEVAA